MAVPLLLTFVVGVSIRIWLYRTPVVEWIASKNEISSPLTSWKRVTEGLTLNKMGISPYSGDIFHEMPLMLRVHKGLDNTFGSSINGCFILLDIIIAILLERIAKHFGKYMLSKQAREVKDYSPDSAKLVLRSNQLGLSRLYVVAIYLLNPYTIATCVGKSSAVFNNMAIALALLYTLKGSKFHSGLFIACAAYISLYPIMLIIPAALFFAQKDAKPSGSPEYVNSMIRHSLIVCGCLAGLLYLSYTLEGSWKFLDSTYGFMLTVPDLNPNMGVFWYFFTEMFEHFRTFFLCVFQINVFIYTVPLGYKLKSDPIFYMYILMMLMAIFKSYPTYADTALYLSLLPMWKHVLPYMRNNFIVTCMFVTCTILGPLLYYLWIYAGSANANFYFAITLVYSAAQIFLVTDLLYGYLRRDYDLMHGMKEPMVNGKPAKIILD